MTKIYLSSTFEDLQGYRETVYKILRQMTYDVIAMEDYVAQDQRPLQKCLEDVESCNRYVGIFAWRYGYIPISKENPEKLSITELEYLKAREKGVPCTIFLLDENVPWPPNLMDANTKSGKSGKRIKALRNKLMQEHIVVKFKSRDHLGSQVAVAVQLRTERPPPIEDDLCFVNIPFGKKLNHRMAMEIDFDAIYQDCIKPTLESLQFRTLRADEESIGATAKKGWKLIDRCRLLITDISNASPNVIYYLGMAHAIGKTVIIISRDPYPHFDLASFPVIFYEDTEKGRFELRDSIVRIVKLLVDKENLKA